MQSGRAYNDMRRIQKITFENRFLIEKINRIYRLGGWIDHRNPYAGCRVSKLPALMKKLRQFEYENLEMLLRILKTVRKLINNSCNFILILVSRAFRTLYIQLGSTYSDGRQKI